MPNSETPPWSASEIGKWATSGDLEKAYISLSEVYRHYLERGVEAPGEYKALHMTLLIGEIRAEMPRRPKDRGIDSRSPASE